MKKSFLVTAATLLAITTAAPAFADDKPTAADEKKDDDDKDKDKDKKDDKSKWQFAGELDALFIRGNSTVVRGSNQDSSGLGFTFGTSGWLTGSASVFQMHFDYLGQIGGGDTGLDGVYQSQIFGGLWLPVTTNVGPFLRVGAGGEYRGNNSYLYSHLDLPMGQAGVIAVANGFSIEAGAEGGITVGGRYNTGNDQRRVLDGAPMYGGFGQIHLLPVLFRGEYRTYSQSHDSPAPEEWKARACAAFPFFKEGLAGPIEVCFDGSWLHGAGTPPLATTSVDSRATYAGLSVGLGFLVSHAGKESADRPSDDKDNTKKDEGRAVESHDNGNGNGNAPVASSSASTLDQDDMRRLTREAMSHFGGSRTMTEWLSASPRPVTAVLPFSSQLSSPPSQDALDTARREAESWLLGSQATVVIDRSFTDKAIAANGGFHDNAAAIAKSANARYVLYGWVEPGQRAPEPQRASYSLVVRVLDTQNNAVVWQHNAEMTKMVQTR
jgi:hypothetical protein